MRAIISVNKEYICITVARDDERSLSWEELQEIKDRFYPYLDFVEVYPKKGEVVNKANERHLIHKVGEEVVKLWDLEQESIVKFVDL